MIAENPTYLLHWQGDVMTKARPRCACRGRNPVVYTDTDYAQWKTSAAREFARQAKLMGVPMPIPWPVTFMVLFVGKHRLSKDVIDNLPGAIADALVDAGVLKGDNSNQAPGAAYNMIHSPDEPMAYIAIAPALAAKRRKAQAKTAGLRMLITQITELADWIDSEEQIAA